MMSQFIQIFLILFLIFLSSASTVSTTSSALLSKISLRQKQTGERVFIDSFGRERIFHGVNAIVKGPPWIPDVNTFSTDISLTDTDFQIMQSLGLNVIRLGTMWPGIEPERNQYNDTYLELLQNITEKAAQYGIYTLLDMHQDVLSEQFCGEGIPSWAVKNDGSFADQIFDNFPSPVLPPFKEKDSYGFPIRQDCAKEGWPNYYVSERTASAFQALWKNVDGVRDSWAAMWARVATQFKQINNNHILGIELMNEPFAGNLYSHPWIMIPLSPFSGDLENMQAAYDSIATSVREVDEDILIFFAGSTWDDFGVNFAHSPGGEKYRDKSVIAYQFTVNYHKPNQNFYMISDGVDYYYPPQVQPDYLQKTDFQFIMQMNKARKLKTGLMLTETCDPFCSGKGGIVDSADVFLQSWASWEWKTFCRENNASLNGESQWAEFGSCKTGYGPNWNESSQMPPNYQSYARTYARAVNGNITSMYFDMDSKEFNLKYKIDPSIEQPTEIYVSEEINYQNGVQISAYPNEKVSIEYDSLKKLIFVRATNKANLGDAIEITVNQNQQQNYNKIDSNEKSSTFLK